MINKLLIPLMPDIDKLYHFFTGFFLACFCLLIDYLIKHFYKSYNFCYLTAFVPTIVAITKEILDTKIKGNFFCLVDIVYTVIPSIIILLIIITEKTL